MKLKSDLIKPPISSPKSYNLRNKKILTKAKPEKFFTIKKIDQSTSNLVKKLAKTTIKSVEPQPLKGKTLRGEDLNLSDIKAVKGWCGFQLFCFSQEGKFSRPG